MGEEVTTECWSCDEEFTVDVEAGEPRIKDDETGEDRCPGCGEEQDMEVEYSPENVHTSRPPGLEVNEDG